MAFTIPNVADAAFSDQAQVDKVDLDILIAGLRGTGITSGSAVTSTGAADGSVSVASGEARIKHQLITVTASSALAIGANSSGNPRYDLISVGTSGTPTVTAGTAAATPVFPNIPADHAVLAAVRVPDGHTTTTTIPANTIVDKRVDLDNQLARDDRGGEDFEVLVQQKSLTRVPFVIKGMNGLSVLFSVKDFLDAPIAWINSAGGFNVNDDIKTAYSVNGPYPFRADIWGYQWRGNSNQCTFAFAGPPGNMLNWDTSVHEKYQADRAGSVGQWTVVGNCTIAAQQQSTPPAEYKTTYRATLRITNTNGSTAWIATNGGAFAISGVVAGQVVSAIAYVRAVTASAARNCNVAVSYYDNGGTQVGSDQNGPTVSVPSSATGAFTKVVLEGNVVPTNATRVQMHIKLSSAVDEVHDVCGAGVMKNAQTAVFAPPFVAQDTTTGAGATVESGAVAGARWVRTDTPGVPGQREYTCHVGGLPPAQVWGPVDSASLYRLDADVTSTSTTAAAVAPWNVAVDPNGFYALDYDLFITSAALTTGWQIGFTGPASPTNFFAVCEYQSSATAWTTATVQSLTTFTLVTAAYVITPNIIRMRIRAQLNNGANAGTLSLTWRSEVGGSAVVIKRGSMLSVT